MLGHEVIFYGVEGSEVECDEFVQVSPQQVLTQVYGKYDWHKQQFKYDSNDYAHKVFNRKAIAEITLRQQPRDFLLVTMGLHHKPIADAVPEMIVVEAGVGYEGIFANYRVFESYAWMHYLYGKYNVADGGFTDCVIPNYFDESEFEFRDHKENYFLYLGRVIKRKGITIAIEAAKAAGMKLKVAGQLSTNEADKVDMEGVEFVGFADHEKRRELMAGARALFVPTYYIEPFGGVVVEANLSGTPVITTDWGAFSETVAHGVNGYRARTLGEFIWAMKNVDKLDPKKIRQYALDNYSLERCAAQYQAYFEQLSMLWDKGWYDTSEELTKHNRYAKFVTSK